MGLSPFFIDGAVSQMQMNGLNIVRAVSKLLGYRRWRPSWLIHLLILFSFDLHFPCLLFGQIVLLHYFIGPLISFFFCVWYINNVFILFMNFLFLDSPGIFLLSCPPATHHWWHHDLAHEAANKSARSEKLSVRWASVNNSKHIYTYIYR